MGTNYFVEIRDTCEHCGRGDKEDLHIGKSSAGWCFSLHVYPEQGINTLEDWKKIWAGKRITDEYGALQTEEEMLSHITDRSWNNPGDATFKGAAVPHGYNSWEHFHQANHSEPGPNGLMRHRIEPPNRYHITNGCVGHGEGTWDYIAGWFS